MLLVRNTPATAGPVPAVLAMRSLSRLTGAVALVLLLSLLSLLYAIPLEPAASAALVAGVTTAIVRLHRNYAFALHGIACAAAVRPAEPS